MKLPKIVLKVSKTDVIQIKEEDLVSVQSDGTGTGKKLLIDGHVGILTSRENGEFMNKCIFLNCNYDYLLGKDAVNQPCLFILRKGTLDHADT